MLAFKAAVSILLLAAVTAVVGYRYGFTGIVENVQQLSMPVIGIIVAGLLANAMVAVLRFKVLASDAGHPIGLRRAMAAVGAGSLAGALFFQLAGQLMARGVIMRRGGVPFGAVVVVTLYERMVAAMVSGLIAIAGALHIFGRVYLDQSAGGGQLVKICCALAAAFAGAAAIGFGPLAMRNVWPLLTRQFVLRFARIAALTVLVQLPMMGVYVALAHEFSPQTPIIDLVAASAIVMFAASVPVSLAGWGVRELSAVVALGAIGMPASGALTTAVMIGAGSLLAMGAVFAMSLGEKSQVASATATGDVAAVDYARALGWIVPLTAAVFVLFQIYVPLGSGLLNVNLADPIAVLGAALFVLQWTGKHRLPQWRVPHVTLFAVITTAVLGFSLLLGASRFGWTNWAVVNRFVGWFVLLAFAATGALIGSIGGARALRVFALTYLGAGLGVVAIELVLVLATAARLPTQGLVEPFAIQGFAQNHNFLAFQLLMACAAAAVFLPDGRLRVGVWSLLLAALWFAGSRSGWISAVCIVGVALQFRLLRIRDLAISLAGAGALAALVAAITVPAVHPGAGGAVATPQFVPTEASNSERLVTLVGGWKLFVGHPLFGAGLGAYRHEDILASSRIPLVIHSTALWLLAELGLVGFLAFAIPGFYVWFTEWRRATTDPASALVTLCFLGFAIMSGPADMVYQRTFWLIVGAALAVPRLSPPERDAPRASVPSPD